MNTQQVVEQCLSQSYQPEVTEEEEQAWQDMTQRLEQVKAQLLQPTE